MHIDSAIYRNVQISVIYNRSLGTMIESGLIIMSRVFLSKNCTLSNPKDWCYGRTKTSAGNFLQHLQLQWITHINKRENNDIVRI